jgi:phospholipid transport system transporter-binding protein
MLLLPDKVDTAVARDTLRMLSVALKRESEPNVTVDASSLRHFDSSALAVLLECQRLAHAWGKGFGVRLAPPKLTQLARLYGIDELLLPPEGSAFSPTASAG